MTLTVYSYSMFVHSGPLPAAVKAIDVPLAGWDKKDSVIFTKGHFLPVNNKKGINIKIKKHATPHNRIFFILKVLLINALAMNRYLKEKTCYFLKSQSHWLLWFNKRSKCIEKNDKTQGSNAGKLKNHDWKTQEYTKLPAANWKREK